MGMVTKVRWRRQKIKISARELEKLRQNENGWNRIEEPKSDVDVVNLTLRKKLFA